MSEPSNRSGLRLPFTNARTIGGRLVTSHVFMALVADEVARAWRYDRMLSVGLAKIDEMTRPSDPAGDLTASEIELALLEFLANKLRAPDKISVLGPGEFGILLPEASARHARAASERLCGQVAEARFELRDIAFGATLSIGTATLSHRVRTSEQLLLSARQEWRRAQAAGGNCVAAAMPVAARTGHVRSAEMH